MRDAVRLFGKRAVAQRAQLLAITGTVLAFTLLLSVILGLASRSPAIAVRDTILAGPASEVSEVLATDLAKDAKTQDAAVQSLVLKTFRGAPLRISRTVVSDPLDLDGSDSRSVSLLPQSSALDSRIRVTTGSLGTLPARKAGEPTPVAIDSAGARALGAKIGSSMTLGLDEGSARVRVVAIWEPKDPTDLDWVGTPAGVGGTAARLIVSQAAANSFGVELRGQWAIAPDPARAKPGDLANMAYGYAHLENAFSREQAFDNSVVSVGGRGAAAVAAMQGSLSAVVSVIPVPVAVLAISAMIALVLLSMLLESSRQNETRLLRARGADLLILVRASLAEWGAIGVVGSVIGGAVAQVLLLVIAGPPGTMAEVIAPLITSIVLSLVIGVALSLASAVRVSGAPRPESGRVRAAASWSLTVLAVAAAGVTLWRFLEYGVPAPGREPDPVGVFAPAATLCALALLGLLALAPLSRVAEGLSTRSHGIRAVLPAREVARNLGVFAAPVALLALAVGASTFAASYSATWSSFVSSSSHMVNGADIRATFTGSAIVNGPADLVDHAAYARIPGVTRAVPVVQTSANLGDNTASVVAVPADQLPGLVHVDPGILDASRLERQLRPGGSPLIGVALPKGTTSVTVGQLATRESAPASPKDSATVLPTIWLGDSDGDLVPVSLHRLPVVVGGDAPVESSMKVPSGGPWRIVAVDVAVHAPKVVEAFTYRLASLTAGGQRVHLPGGLTWTVQPSAYGIAPLGVTAHKDAIRLAIPLVTGSRSHDSAYRLMPAASTAVPVVVSQGLAAAVDLRVGSTVTFDGTWATFRGRVAGIVPLAPGGSDGLTVIADLAAFDNGALRMSEQMPIVNELWISGDETAAGRVASRAGPTANVTTASGALVREFLGSAVAGAWIGAAGCMAFAIVAFAAALAAVMRRRRGEISVLRAIGFTANQQGLARRTEIVAIVAFATIFGAVSGGLVSALAVGVLARLSVATAPRSLPVPGHIDVAGLLIALAVSLAVVVVVSAVYERAVRVRAVQPEWEGES